MKVRFFNTFDTAAPFFRTLLPHLASRGHEVEAVLARQQYRPGGLQAVNADYRIRQVPTVEMSLGGRGGKLSIAASYSLAAAAVSLPSRWPDVDVFLTQPPLFTAWGRVLRALHRRPYCIVGMDLYPWVAIEAGVVPRRSVRARVAESLAVASLEGASRFIAIGRCMVDRVTGFGISPGRIRMIPNWADTDVIRPVARESNPLRAEHGLEGKFVVMYSGNLGVSHYFDDLLEVACRLRRLPDWVLLFVGSGSRLQEVQDRSRELGLENVRFLGYQDYELLSESLGMGDVHFVSLRPGFEGLVVPSKTYGVLAAGRPVVYQGSATGEIARMLEETETGTVVGIGDVEELEKAILQAYEDPAGRESVGQRARRVAEERYSPGPGVQAYAEVLEDLVGTRVEARAT